jgi:hypothetical protein
MLRVALVHPVHEALHAGVDDGFGLRHGGLAAGLRRFAPRWPGRPRCRGRRRAGLDFGLDVARHGQVDHEHGAVAALLEGALDGAQADDGQVLAVQLTTMSNSCRRSGRSARRSHLGAKAARPAFRRAPACGWRWRWTLGCGGKVRGASSIISPAPTNSTLVLPRSSNRWLARRTAAAAMLMLWAPISVRCAPPWRRQSCAGTAG